jgi:hypothetical protein
MWRVAETGLPILDALPRGRHAESEPGHRSCFRRCRRSGNALAYWEVAEFQTAERALYGRRILRTLSSRKSHPAEG